MKKLLLAFAAILGSVTILPTGSNAAATSNATGEQILYVRSEQPRRWGRPRTVIRTRVVWRFGRRYRETIRVTYRGNRIVRVRVIRRVPLYGIYY